MTRSEFDDIRAHIAAEARRPGQQVGDLLQLATDLLDDLEQVRVREAMLRSSYLALLAAARATVAAEAAGHPTPLTLLAHELAKHGQLPSSDQEHPILVDAPANTTLIPSIDEPAASRPARGVRARYCGRVGRTLRG